MSRNRQKNNEESSLSGTDLALSPAESLSAISYARSEGSSLLKISDELKRKFNIQHNEAKNPQNEVINITDMCFVELWFFREFLLFGCL